MFFQTRVTDNCNCTYDCTMMMSHTVSVIGQMFHHLGIVHPPCWHRPIFHRGVDLGPGHNNLISGA